eukprot:TRINITY_DN16027_c0_g1_i1.p1 TRINITY_DN16027_c0_g1~~TRINITY_DN16027_c0_g1_i1.p1  ORF type:complete len:167 (+),score=13.54 TRINITY_DN16027_c0_g1_i1:3-503(+)
MAVPYKMTFADHVHYWFFASHIPITMLIDSQAVLPASLFPSILKQTVRWYAETTPDPMMANPPGWFKPLVAGEVLLQLPFFFLALQKIPKGDNTLRLPGLVYGVHVATTLMPIFGEVFFGDATAELPLKNKLLLAAIYSPYFLIPLHFAYTMYTSEQPYAKRLKPN